MNHQTKNPVIFLTILFTLVSCKPKQSVVIQNMPCSPPCWNNIIPGQTNKQEVLNILHSTKEVDSNSIKDAGLITSGINDNVWWLFNSQTSDVGGRIYFNNGLVSVIDLGPHEGTLSFKEAINKLGDPDKILAYTEIGDNRRLAIYALNLMNGYALVTWDDNFSYGKKATLDGNQTVKAIFYFSPESFEKIMTIGPINFLDPTTLQKGLQPWTGFGEIPYTDNNR